MSTRYEDLTPTLLENTTMQKVYINDIHKLYRITPNEGYVLHDNGMDIYNNFDEEGNPIGEPILGYRTSMASCSVTQLVVDADGNIITNTREFYAVPASSVPADQIFGNTDTEVM